MNSGLVLLKPQFKYITQAYNLAPAREALRQPIISADNTNEYQLTSPGLQETPYQPHCQSRPETRD